MAAYLLTWNPKTWHWEDLQDCIKAVKEEGYYSRDWSCGNTKKIKKGDRFFLIRLGKQPWGIFASGWVESEFYKDKHYSEENKKANYVDIRIDVLLF